MFSGGWLYPVPPSIGGTVGELAFNEDEFDCAASGKVATEANSAPARRHFQVFQTSMTFLPFNSPANADGDFDSHWPC
jgi:hypothetical protein